MKTVIYYYSGTGNSLWSAKLLAKELENTEIIPIVNLKENFTIEADNVGLVFPVHSWGLIPKVIDFVKNMPVDDSKYYFALGVNAGQVAATLKQLEKLMKTRGLKLSSGFDIVLPSNYIPWGGAIAEDKQQDMFRAVKDKMIKIAHVIKNQEKLDVEKGPIWQNILFTLLYKLSYNQMPKMAKNFWVDDKCNGCGVCEKVCPVQNISLVEKKPQWLGHCEQCLACIQWCPEEAIQYGKKTPKYKRYHHPDVKIKDMFLLP